MASIAKDAVGNANVDYRLLNRLSNLVICSCCLRRGIITPVPQVISNRHALTNECPACRHEKAARGGRPKMSGKLLTLKQ